MTRKELKERLPHGYQTIIAKELGVSTNSISQFLRGKNNSRRIERAVISCLLELKKERDEVDEMLNQLKA